MKFGDDLISLRFLRNVFLVVVVLVVVCSMQGVFAVDTTINPGNGTINDGLSSLDNGGTLNLDSGNYSGTGNSNITIDKNVTIKGSNSSNTIIFGNGNDPVFIVEDGNTLTLINLTIFSNYLNRGNDSAVYGGMVHISNGSIVGQGNLVFSNSVFINDENDINLTVNASSHY
ncbi:hypothetical protein KQY27_05875, partial [Methanobrevibacter sp. TMH8]|nr:hypothetical protein [Methanobrevibacter sp. TMH8]